MKTNKHEKTVSKLWRKQSPVFPALAESSGRRQISMLAMLALEEMLSFHHCHIQNSIIANKTL
jgi:hypothetical protein